MFKVAQVVSGSVRTLSLIWLNFKFQPCLVVPKHGSVRITKVLEWELGLLDVSLVSLDN